MSQHYTPTGHLNRIGEQYRDAIALGVRKGWISRPKSIAEMDEAINAAARAKMTESARMCYKRLKAEQSGLPTDQFPPRVRRVNKP